MPYAILAGHRPAPDELHPLRLVVCCDAEHGFLPLSESFAVGHEHPRSPAIRAGWLITDEGRVYCPQHRRRE